MPPFRITGKRDLCLVACMTTMVDNNKSIDDCKAECGQRGRRSTEELLPTRSPQYHGKFLPSRPPYKRSAEVASEESDTCTVYCLVEQEDKKLSDEELAKCYKDCENQRRRRSIEELLPTRPPYKRSAEVASEESVDLCTRDCWSKYLAPNGRLIPGMEEPMHKCLDECRKPRKDKRSTEDKKVEEEEHLKKEEKRSFSLCKRDCWVILDKGLSKEDEQRELDKCYDECDHPPKPQKAFNKPTSEYGLCYQACQIKTIRADVMLGDNELMRKCTIECDHLPKTEEEAKLNTLADLDKLEEDDLCWRICWRKYMTIDFTVIPGMEDPMKKCTDECDHAANTSKEFDKRSVEEKKLEEEEHLKKEEKRLASAPQATFPPHFPYH